jgi:hypothetical protein
VLVYSVLGLACPPRGLRDFLPVAVCCIAQTNITPWTILPPSMNDLKGLLFSRPFLCAEKEASSLAGACARVAAKFILVRKYFGGFKMTFEKHL